MSTRQGSERVVAVVTGTRAEFGLLAPVMRAIQKQRGLGLRVIATGTHMLKPSRTIREVEAQFDVAAKVQMQLDGATGRGADAVALGRGVIGLAKAYDAIKPEWVVVLGDRIEALAAASAASVAGIAVCHIHGGDRAEGIADEAMRHAITKLSHLHCAATERSARRIVRMGEREVHVHVTGSPAIDGLREIEPMGDEEAAALGDPRVVMLLHPSGGEAEGEFAMHAFVATAALSEGGEGARGMFLHPNHDPGRELILEQWRRVVRFNGWPLVDHLPRERFVALLKRMAARQRGFLMGNSSAGLIECAALGVPALNLGPRQAGRERAGNVIDADPMDTFGMVRKIRRVDRLAGKLRPSTLFGDGRAGERIARLLSAIDPHAVNIVRKRNTY